MNWKLENYVGINAMWDDLKSKSTSRAVVCRYCEEPHSDWCECARVRFVVSLTEDEFFNWKHSR